MTLKQACEFLVEQAQYYKDLSIGPYSYPLDSPDVKLRGLVMRGMRIFASRVRPIDPDVGLTLAASTSRYSLQGAAMTHRVIVPLHAFVVGHGRTYGPSGKNDGEPWSIAQMDKYTTEWRTEPEGEPSRVIWISGTNELIAWPTPSAAWIAAQSVLANQVRLTAHIYPNELATDGTDDAEELPMPIDLHEGICLCALAAARKATAASAEVWKQIEITHAEWVQIAEEAATRQLNAYLGDLNVTRNRKGRWLLEP